MTKKSFTTLVLFAALTSSAFAAGVGKLSITSQNDRFTSSGSISADSQSSGGVSTAVAAQRAIMPVAAGKVDYKSSGNQYTSSGQITAKSKSSGGVSTAVAAQEAVL